MRWIFALLLLSCSSEVGPDADPCESWTWIDEDGCSGDVCAEQGQEVDGYECRAGECWCCFEGDCWEGS